ncbi:MAG TPA: hypothetical protein VFA52_02625 [Candidatus Paceibacterota bacterium]|nr:hypothetical protein [Candidatus Paceibacterota bacterium]
MNKYITNIVLAVVIAIIPLLGFPPSWRAFFIIVLALIVAVSSYFIYREQMARMPRSNKGPKASTFIENDSSSSQ